MEYYGLDVHKLSITYTCVDVGGRVLRRGRVPNTYEDIREIVAPSSGEAWVVLEATRAWSFVYDTLESTGVRIFLAHARRVKAIASAKVKTDSVDSETLVHLLRTGLLPVSYAPPPPVRSWREMLRTRHALVRMRTTFYCRIQILLAKEGLLCPASDIFGRRGRRWLQAQELTPVHRQLVDLLTRQADALKKEITLLEDNLREALSDHPALDRLLTVPGFGFLTAATFLAEVGDVSRFPRARNLVSYLGLAPRVHASGGRVRMGRLTKEGPPLVRSYLVQASYNAIRRPGVCQDLYGRVYARSGSQAARVAVARKLVILAFLAWRFGVHVPSRE